MSRLRIRRRPLVYWSLTGTLALVTGMVVSGAVAGAREARAEYGTARAVVVATHDIPAGTTIDRDDIEIEARPIALVPRARSPSHPSTRSRRRRSSKERWSSRAASPGTG